MDRGIRALLAIVVGLPLAAAGVVVTGWAALAMWGLDGAFDTALVVAEHWPYPLYATPTQVATDALHNEKIVFILVIALVAYFIGAGMVRAAFGRARPTDVSDDGLARLELKDPDLRVGHPVEGRLRLLKKSKPGEVFDLALRCRRTYRPDGADRDQEETAFYEGLQVAAVQDAGGLSVPFRFTVPVTAPATAGDSRGFAWRLEVSRAKAWISFYSGFTLRMGDAAPAELRAFEAAQPAGLRGEIDRLEGKLVALGKPSFTPHQRAQLAALPAEKREEMRRMLDSVDAFGSVFQKIVLAVFLAGAVVVALGFVFVWVIQLVRPAS